MINETIALENNTITITCEALGYPPPTVQWDRIDGTLSDGVSVSDSVSVPTGYGNVTRVSVNLTITNASREDTGVYMCSANNSVGSDNKNASVTIECKLLSIFYNKKRIMYLYTYIQFEQKLSLSTIVLNSRDWSEIIWLLEILRFKINLAISFIQKNQLECIG